MTSDIATQSGLDALDTETRLRVRAKTASALADPMRLAILGLLRARGELTVGELAGALPVSQPRVSVHLRCLTDCGYTTTRRAGRRCYYRLAGPEISELLDRLDAHAVQSLQGLLACLRCEPAGDPTPDNQGDCC